MRIAFSLASAPPAVKKTFSKPSGARCRISRAASARVAFPWAGATVVSLDSCSVMPAMILGCWWPMFVNTSWPEKSR